MASQFARVLLDERCSDVAVLDLRGLSGLCDFLVIGTGSSRPQMKNAVTKVELYARSVGESPLPAPDRSTEQWMLADYVNVVVHVMDAGSRAHYDLEMMWGDAPRVSPAAATLPTG